MTDEIKLYESNNGLCFFNGIDASTGEYLIPSLDYARIAASIRAKSPPQAENLKTQEENLKNWVAATNQRMTTPSFGLPFGTHPEQIESVGWGIVFHQDEDEAVKKALEPLIEHRHRQINNDSLLKILDYLPGDGISDWLGRYKVTSSNVIPTKVPYYLLLVGSPERIPFLFGYLLDAEYAVGRLHFDTITGYENYVASLIDYETRPSLSNTKEVTFFAPRHNFDAATQLSADKLIDPLADNVLIDDLPNISNFNFASQKYRKEKATKSQLIDIFRRDRSPAILFTASHGQGFSNATSEPEKQRQFAEQGALICQDWPGFGKIAPDHYFSAADLPADANLQGTITFLFACYGGGTPSSNRFLQFERNVGMPAIETLAERDFFAALPKALLSHPQGGALATIAHVERAWGCSFIHPQAGEQLLPFANAIGRILAGQPVGHAMDDFNRKYINLSAVLTSKLENQLNKPITDEQLAQDWLERNDAESYIILGDPAVKLRVDLLQPPN